MRINFKGIAVNVPLFLIFGKILNLIAREIISIGV
jgi:hypothetical protein